MTQGLENLSSEKRLKKLHHLTLEQRKFGDTSSQYPRMQRTATKRTEEKTGHNGYKLDVERFHLNRRKKIYSDNNHSLQQHPQGHGRVPNTRGFQDGLIQTVSCEVLDQKIPEIPSNLSSVILCIKCLPLAKASVVLIFIVLFLIYPSLHKQNSPVSFNNLAIFKVSSY